MGHNKWLRCAFGAALAFLLSGGSIACLLTAFDLSASVGTVLSWCMLASVVFSIACTLKLQWLPLGICALLAGFLWQSGSLSDSYEGLLYRITGVYNLVHGWPITGEKHSVDMILCAMGMVCAYCVSSAVCGGRSRVFGVLFSLLPVALCFPLTNTSPEPLWLGIWLFGLSMLLLCKDGKRTAAFLAVPVALFTAVLLLVLPQSAQEGPRAFAHAVSAYLQELGIGAAPGKPMKVDGGALELSKLGARKEYEYPVMTVTDDRGGTLYLRGCAYDTYFRNNWTNLALRDQSVYWPEEQLLEPAGTVTVQTEYAQDLRFFPYYALGKLEGVTRGINNYAGALSYEFSYGVLPAQPDSYTQLDGSYTQLPVVTQRWAEGVVATLISPDMTDRQKIDAITQYVRGCAKYSLYAEKMPSDAQDFVVWFVQSAEKGYCIHFASAATVLLRAAGLPSRFVTGYMVQTQPGVPTTVYGKDAHAWAECFLEGIGWVPVEATPGMQAGQTQTAEEKPVQTHWSPAPMLYAGIALVGVTALALVVQWRVRVTLRSRKRKKGSTNRRFLAGYRQLTALLELVQEQPADSLTALAQQAQYSPHALQQAHLTQLEAALKNAKKRLKKEPILKKLHYRLILALY